MNEGTQAAPVRTLAQAIQLAQSQTKHKRVYACGEIFNEPARLPKGVSLYGGFDCGAPAGPLQWTYKGAPFRTTIAPPPDLVALVLLDGVGDATSFAGDLIPKAADATVPGGSSIAVLAQDNAKAEVRRIEVIAGNGADGAPGEAGNPITSRQPRVFGVKTAPTPAPWMRGWAVPL